MKLLLSLNESLNPQLRDELSGRIEDVSVNPLENDLNVETKLAQQQYENLMAFAARPDGLPKRLAEERREEMSRLVHGSKKRVFFGLAHLMSLGLYTHREPDTPEFRAALDTQRRLDYHERYLRETARDSIDPAIDGNLDQLRQSLDFVAKNGGRASSQAAEAVAGIFAITDDERTQKLCLQSLGAMDNKKAKTELLAIYENEKVETRWRNLSAEFLHLEVKDEPEKSGVEKTAIKDDQP